MRSQRSLTLNSEQINLIVRSEGLFSPDSNFDTDVFLTSKEKNMLYNYFNGVKDADEGIAQLVTELDKLEEPVVLVYFGDHLPGFANGMDFFEILDYDIDIEGTTKQKLAIYETPYFIWQNESAKNSTKILQNRQKIALPKQNIDRKSVV